MWLNKEDSIEFYKKNYYSKRKVKFHINNTLKTIYVKDDRELCYIHNSEGYAKGNYRGDINGVKFRIWDNNINILKLKLILKLIDMGFLDKSENIDLFFASE